MDIIPRLNDLIRKQGPINLTLAVFIVYGLVCKLLISLNYSLNSDGIYPGILINDIAVNHNYLLKGYYLFSMNNGLFGEIPLHVIPQILTNYNPYALRLVAFILFILVILVYSYIIYRTSGQLACALVFAALLANIDPTSYYTFFAQPSFHISTMLYAGIAYTLSFYTSVLQPDRKSPASIIKTALFIIFVSMIAFSDGIFIAMFTIPFVITYVFYKEKTLESNACVVVVCAMVGAVYIFSAYFYNRLGLAHFLSIPASRIGLDTVLNHNVPLYLSGLIAIFNYGIYKAILNIGSIDLAVLPLVICALVMAYYTAKRFLFDRDPKQKKLGLFFIVSAATISVPYLLTSLCVDIFTSRYLSYISLFAFILISLAYTKVNKIMLIAIMAFLVMCAAVNFAYVSGLDYRPNAGESQLIDYLEARGLTYGYGGYWESNIITYLSNNAVIIRPVGFGDNEIVPFRMLSDEGWFDYFPQNYFMIIDTNKADQVNAINSICYMYPINRTLAFGHYRIYVFNSTDDDNRPLNAKYKESGWYRIENWNVPTQWMSDNATKVIYSGENKNATLSFTVKSFYRPRTLQVFDDGELAYMNPVSTEFNTVKVNLTLKKGYNTILFNSVDGSQRPADIPEADNKDDRYLSFAFQNLSIV